MQFSEQVHDVEMGNEGDARNALETKSRFLPEEESMTVSEAASKNANDTDSLHPLLMKIIPRSATHPTSSRMNIDLEQKDSLYVELGDPKLDPYINGQYVYNFDCSELDMHATQE